MASDEAAFAKVQKQLSVLVGLVEAGAYAKATAFLERQPSGSPFGCFVYRQLALALAAACEPRAGEAAADAQARRAAMVAANVLAFCYRMSHTSAGHPCPSSADGSFNFIAALTAHGEYTEEATAVFPPTVLLAQLRQLCAHSEPREAWSRTTASLLEALTTLAGDPLAPPSPAAAGVLAAARAAEAQLLCFAAAAAPACQLSDPRAQQAASALLAAAGRFLRAMLPGLSREEKEALLGDAVEALSPQTPPAPMLPIWALTYVLLPLAAAEPQLLGASGALRHAVLAAAPATAASGCSKRKRYPRLLARMVCLLGAGSPTGFTDAWVAGVAQALPASFERDGLMGAADDGSLSEWEGEEPMLPATGALVAAALAGMAAAAEPSAGRKGRGGTADATTDLARMRLAPPSATQAARRSASAARMPPRGRRFAIGCGCGDVACAEEPAASESSELPLPASAEGEEEEGEVGAVGGAVEGEEGEVCLVCCSGARVAELGCDHPPVLCGECAQAELDGPSPSCPLCRRKLA